MAGLAGGGLCVGGVFPLAQDGLAVAHAVAVAAAIDLGVEAVVELAELVLDLRELRGADAALVAESLDGLDGGVEEVPHYLLRVCRGILGGAVLGAPLVGAFPRAVRALLQTLHPHLHGREHDGQSLGAQELAVEGVAVVLPEVVAAPCAGLGVLPCHPVGAVTEDVVLGEACPPLGVAEPRAGVALPYGLHDGHVVEVVEVLLVHLRQAGRLGWPIVHLYVDVGVYVGVPCRTVAVVPDALQVVGEVYAPGAGDEHVSAVGEVQLFEHSCVGRACDGRLRGEGGIGVDELVGGLGVGGSVEVEAAAVEECRVVGHMCVEQCLPTLVGGGLHGAHDALRQLLCAGHEAGGNGVVVGAGAEDDENLVGTVHLDGSVGGGEGAAGGHHLHGGVVGHCLQLAREGGLAVGAGAALVVCVPEAETLAELSGSRGGEVYCHDLVWCRGDVLASEGDGLVGALPLCRGHGGLEVEGAHILLGALGRGGAEHVGEVFDDELAEVLVAGAAVVVVRRAGDECLLVELHDVLAYAAIHHGTELAVADGQGILHPRVGHGGLGDGRGVPECELMLGAERVPRCYVPLGELGGMRVGVGQRGGVYEEQWIVGVAGIPCPELAARAVAAPLVHARRGIGRALYLPRRGVGAVGGGSYAQLTLGRCRCGIAARAAVIIYVSAELADNLAGTRRAFEAPQLCVRALVEVGGGEAGTLALVGQCCLATAEPDDIPLGVVTGGEHWGCLCMGGGC